MRYAVRMVFAVVLLSLVACVGNPAQIGTNLTLCCPGNYDSYNSYSLQTAEMPGFLESYVVAEFDAAMAETGLSKNNNRADLQVTLRYNHVNLSSEQQNIDPFMRVESMTNELNYNATIEIEMRESSSGELVWAGSVNRNHRVIPGEYMHQDSARPAFRRAFRSVLSNYPSQTASN